MRLLLPALLQRSFTKFLLYLLINDVYMLWIRLASLMLTADVSCSSRFVRLVFCANMSS